MLDLHRVATGLRVEMPGRKSQPSPIGAHPCFSVRHQKPHKKVEESKLQVSPNPKQAAAEVLVGYCQGCPEICKIIEEQIVKVSRRNQPGPKGMDVAARGRPKDLSRVADMISPKDLPMAADTIKRPLSLFETLPIQWSDHSPSSGWSGPDLSQERSCWESQETAVQAFTQYQPAPAEFEQSPIHFQAKRLMIERMPKSWDIHDFQNLIQETPSLCMCCDVDKVVMPESGVALVALRSESCAIKWHHKLSNMIVSHPTGNFPLKVSVAEEIQEHFLEDSCENKEKTLLDKMLTESKKAVQANSENTLLTKLLDS